MWELELGGVPVVDAHMHPFWTAEENLGMYGTALAKEDVPLELARTGVRMFCGSVARRIGMPEDFEPVAALNRHAMYLREQYGEVYLPGIHIHPAFPKESCREIVQYRSKGVRLIGELVPYMMGWDSYLAPGALEAFDLAQDLNMVVSLHPSTEDEMNKLPALFPKLRILYAHPGEKEKYLAHIARMKRFKNVWLDLCGTGLFRMGMLRHGIDQLGSERFLFGTDYPICNPAMQVCGILYETRTEQERENIFYQNALELFGVK